MEELIGMVMEFVQANMTIVIAGGAFLALLPFIIGLITGLRRSFYRVITCIIFFVVLLFTAPAFSRWIYNLDLGGLYSSILPSGFSGNTLKEIAGNFIGQYVALEEAQMVLVDEFVCLVIRVLYVTVLALVLNLVYWLLTTIIYAIFFKKKKKKDENGKKIKVKKHRFLGGLVNELKFVCVIVFVAVIIVSGPLEIATSFLNNLDETGEALDDLFNEYGLKDVVDQVNSYYPEFIRNMYEKGEDGEKDKFSIFGWINDQIYTLKVGEEEIDLITEVDGLFTLTDDLLSLYGGITQEPMAIDFSAIANVCYYFEDSKLLNALLPAAADFAANYDAVKDLANQYGVDISCISEVEWEGTFTALGDLAIQIGDIISDIQYVEVPGGGLEIHRMYDATPVTLDPSKITLIDLTKISKEKVTALFTALSNISLITVLMDEAIKAGVNLPQVKEMIGDLELELDGIVWKDEICNLGNVVNAFLDVGFKCVNDIMGDFKKTLNNLSFGDITVEDDLGGLGKLFDSLFASRFIDQVFGVAMEKVVLPKIPEAYQGMFDFDSINDKGWPNEFNDLLKIFKDAKGADNVFFKEDGSFNLEIINTIKPETLLKSAIIPNAVISLLVDAKNGTGVLASLSDTLVIPDALANKDASEWKEEVDGYYVVNKDFKVGEKDYSKYTRVTLAEYGTLEETNKAKCTLVKKIVGGEIYNLFDVLPDLLSIIDISSLSGGSGESPIALNNETLKKLTKKDSEGKSIVSKLSNSLIVRATISKFITEMGGDLIIVPTSVADPTLVNGATKYVIKADELERVFEGIVKLEIMQDKYTTKEAFGDFYEKQEISKEQFNALTDEEKELIEITGEINAGIGMVDKLEEYDYKCIEAIDNFKVGDVITLAEYNALDTEKKAKFAKNYMVQDYLFGSEDNVLKASDTLVATISKLISSADSVIKVPTEGTGSVVATGYVDINGNPIQYMIYASELRSVIKAINALGIIEKQYVVQVMFEYEGHTYNELDVLTEEAFNALPGEDKLLCSEDAKVNASMGLISVLAGKDENGINNVDYISGENGSKILYATICDIIIEQGKDSSAMLVIPNDTIGTVGQYKIILKDDFNSLVVGIDALGLIKEYQCATSGSSYEVGTLIPKSEFEMLDEETKTHFNKVNATIEAGIGVVSELLYLVDETDRRMDKVINSDILSATIAKFVLENASSITIPSAAKVSIQRYTETGAVAFDVVTNTELSELLVSLCELEIVQNGTINASIDLINKIDGKYTYKPGLETKETGVDQDSLEVIDHINNSLIMRATISEKIFEQSSTIDVLDVVTENVGTTKLIQAQELKNLISAINALGIIQGGAVSDINSIAGTILTDEAKQEKIIDSVILRATLTNKVGSSGSLDIPLDALDMLYEGNIIGQDIYVELDSASQLTISMTFVTVSGNNVKLMSKDELQALFNSLNLLGITSFEGVNVSFNSIKTLLNENQLGNLFKCRTIWEKTSALCTETGSGSDLFTLPVFGQDYYQVYENNDNKAYLSNTVYNTLLTDPQKENYELKTIYSYDRDILFADTYKRLTVKEIESILKLITLLGDGGDNFNVDASAFTSVYTDPTKRSQLATIMTDSGILLQNINKLFGNAITNATTGTAFESYTSSIPTKIAAISENDITLWAKYSNEDYDHTTEMYNTSFAYITDNQLDKLLAGLNALTSITAPEQILNDKNTVLAIDDSYCLRSLLSSLEYSAGQPILAYYEVTTAFLTYNVGDKISSAEYMVISSMATGKVTQHAYNANDSYTDRITNCIDVIYTLIPTV